MLESFNTLELSVILLEGDNERGNKVSRKITSIYGLPFYCSSGINSNYEGTWFPFFGVTPYGVFAKKLTPTDNLPPLFYKLFDSNTSYQLKSDLPSRFASLGCLLVSSCLGGGIWNTEKGLELIAYLKAAYPEFYVNWPWMLLDDPEITFNEDSFFEINRWLLAKSNLNQPKELSTLFPLGVQELFELKTRSEQLEKTRNLPRQKQCCVVQ